MITLSEYLIKNNFLANQYSYLTEGGLAGHLSHLYDEHDLSFGELKYILNQASTGKLQTVEKTDGQNIYLSYNLEDNQAKAVRNTGQIIKGGINAEELNSLFKDRPENIRNSFVNAVLSFEQAVSTMNPRAIRELFGPSANVFYNCEIVNPLTSNVIKYNKNYIIIHGSNHRIREPFVKVNKEPFNENDLDANVNYLINNLEKFQQNNKQLYTFSIDPVIELSKIDADVALNKALTDINSLLKKYNLKDTNNIGDYMSAVVSSLLKQINIDIPEEIVDLIVDKVLERPETPSVPQINKLIKTNYPELFNTMGNEVTEFMKRRNEIFSQAIHPLENIIHNFAVEMLKGVHSVFVAQPEQETTRIRNEVMRAIQSIEASGDERAHNILKKQLQKLASVENITSSIEGVVFPYKGHVYKFTGNFAPINQLLGIFKYPSR